MSKFGWDLPPGCSASDIPGNRPEDILTEQLINKIYAIFVPDEPTDEQVFDLRKLLDEQFQAGYQEATSDNAEERMHLQDQIKDLQRWIADVKPILARGG